MKGENMNIGNRLYKVNLFQEISEYTIEEIVITRKKEIYYLVTKALHSEDNIGLFAAKNDKGEIIYISMEGESNYQESTLHDGKSKFHHTKEEAYLEMFEEIKNDLERKEQKQRADMRETEIAIQKYENMIKGYKEVLEEMKDRM